MIDRMGNWYPDYPGQQPLQDQAFVRTFGIGQQGQAQQTPALTPPTIHADIVQVEGPEGIERYPLAAGATQMFMTKDEQLILIRTQLQNGQHTDEIYDRRPPAPPAAPINPADFVRRDELAALLAEMQGKGRRNAKTAEAGEAE